MNQTNNEIETLILQENDYIKRCTSALADIIPNSDEYFSISLQELSEILSYDKLNISSFETQKEDKENYLITLSLVDFIIKGNMNNEGFFALIDIGNLDEEQFIYLSDTLKAIPSDEGIENLLLKKVNNAIKFANLNNFESTYELSISLYENIINLLDISEPLSFDDYVTKNYDKLYKDVQEILDPSDEENFNDFQI